MNSRLYILWSYFVNIDFKKHLVLSLALRLLLIAYGVHHDQVSEVKYTDIDYKVFTDASRHVLNGNSPYERHTYRYTPLVAILLIPNLLIHHSFGKVLFSLVDIVVAILIKTIVKHVCTEYEQYEGHKNLKTENTDLKKLNSNGKRKWRQRNKHRGASKAKKDTKTPLDVIADTAMISWLYNPMTIAIGTRGNCDSIAGFLVLLTLYFLQCKKQYFTAGLVHGLSVHFRLYPIIYSLTFFMFLSKFSFYSTEDRRFKRGSLKSIGNNLKVKQLKNMENTLVESSSLGGHRVMAFNNGQKERKTIFKKEYLFYIIPNLNQLKLVFGCLLSLFSMTGIFYHFYGYTFLHETYIYHFVRKDTRHNFSMYFYLLYLTAWVRNIGLWQKVLIILPQLILILVFSVRYGLNKFSLNFSILVQTIVMVIYNSVLTSQYFVWIMAILPLCLWQIKMPIKKALLLLAIWFIAQIVWLLPAYLLEFQGENTFMFVWIQSVSFFCANIAILGRLITYFQPVSPKSV